MSKLWHSSFLLADMLFLLADMSFLLAAMLFLLADMSFLLAAISFSHTVFVGDIPPLYYCFVGDNFVLKTSLRLVVSSPAQVIRPPAPQPPRPPSSFSSRERRDEEGSVKLDVRAREACRNSRSPVVLPAASSCSPGGVRRRLARDDVHRLNGVFTSCKAHLEPPTCS